MSLYFVRMNEAHDIVKSKAAITLLGWFLVMLGAEEKDT